MQPLCAFTLLYTLSFLSPVLSIKHCNDTQYAWPLKNPHLCCDKCPPGKYMVQSRRDNNLCDIVCEPCTGSRFTEKHNTMMACDICDNCNKQNMRYRSNCNTTHNAVCGCKAGYRCENTTKTNEYCKQCVPIPSTTTTTIPSTTTTTTTTPPPSTTALKPEALTTSWEPSQPMRDTVWFLVIIALLCAGIAIVVVTKIKPFLSWIKSKHGYFLAKEPAPPCSEDGVCMPVQEGCGKCDV